MTKEPGSPPEGGVRRQRTRIERMLSAIADVRRGEATVALLMMLLIFLILAAYYELKTAREVFILSQGAAIPMHNLLIMTAVLEGATGLAFVVLPSRLGTLLLGAQLDAPSSSTLARVAGVALVALAVTCWLAPRREVVRQGRQLKQ